MLLIIILGFLLYAGWSQFPWWTPIAVLAGLSPLMLFQVVSVNAWRQSAGLSGYQVEDIVLNLAVSLAITFAAYGCGIGARKLLRPSARSA